jgi:hypothetical protein
VGIGERGVRLRAIRLGPQRDWTGECECTCNCGAGAQRRPGPHHRRVGRAREDCPRPSRPAGPAHAGLASRARCIRVAEYEIECRLWDEREVAAFGPTVVSTVRFSRATELPSSRSASTSRSTVP